MKRIVLSQNDTASEMFNLREVVEIQYTMNVRRIWNKTNLINKLKMPTTISVTVNRLKNNK